MANFPAKMEPVCQKETSVMEEVIVLMVLMSLQLPVQVLLLNIFYLNVFQ